MNLKSSFHRLASSERLYQINIPIIALTGGIASGKSTVTNMLLNKSLPLLDADKLVKLVYQKEAVTDYLKAHYPEVISGNDIEFRKLREIFFSDPKVKIAIETLIYSHLPFVFKEELEKLGTPSFVLYDIPLLFEKKLEDKFDLSVLVYTTPELQIKRLMVRDHHTKEEAHNIINHQISIEEKKKRADLIVSNTGDLNYLQAQVEKLCDQLFE